MTEYALQEEVNDYTSWDRCHSYYVGACHELLGNLYRGYNINASEISLPYES